MHPRPEIVKNPGALSTGKCQVFSNFYSVVPASWHYMWRAPDQPLPEVRSEGGATGVA